MDIRCRNCRKPLISPEQEVVIQNVHNVDSRMALTCQSMCLPTSIYIDPESVTEVDWLQRELISSEWSKGKLKCPSCQVVVGSFSFTSSVPCQCGQTQLPSMQLIVSKVDVKKDLQLN